MFNKLFSNNKTPSDFKSFTLQTLIIILLALPIGIVDMKLQNIRNNNKKLSKIKRIILIFIEIMISIVYVYVLMKNIPYIADNFQITYPGLFFAGVYYSLQFNMFTDIIALFKETL